MAVGFAIAGSLLGAVTSAHAGCGCEKPPPPRAAVRPFVAHSNQSVTLFDERLVDGARYEVRFESTTDGRVEWSRGKVAVKRDFADRQLRKQLRVRVADVGLGPVAISVWTSRTAPSPVYALSDDQFTMTSEPVTLHDFRATVSRKSYQAGIGRDGTVYLAVDVSKVDGGTRFTGTAIGFPVNFRADSVVMYNEQGFLMQLLDPTKPGLFELYAGGADMSDTLSYWRHEFRTWKAQHREDDRFATDDDPEWHGDGTPHIEHDRIIVAIRALTPSGLPLTPGSTPPFQLVVTSDVEER